MMTTQAAAQAVEHDDKTLFEAKTSDALDLKRLFKTVDAVVSEVPISIGPDGVRFRTADPAMVAMIDLMLKPDFFGHYRCNVKDEVLFMVDTDELKARVSEAKKADDVTLVLRRDRRGDKVLDVKVWSDGITSTFTIPTREADASDVPDADELEFSGAALVALPMFRAAVQKMGPSTQFTLREDRFVMASDVEEQVARVRFPESSDHLHAVRLSNGPVCSCYATDYLEIVKGLRNTVKRFRLQFGTDYPLKLSVENDRFDLAFIVAPRIEE